MRCAVVQTAVAVVYVCPIIAFFSRIDNGVAAVLGCETGARIVAGVGLTVEWSVVARLSC
jgi:hypothetical protein